MKTKLIILLFACISSGASALEAKSDSTKKKTKTLINIGNGQFDVGKDSTGKGHPNFSIQLTFSRLDLGLAKFTDKESFTLSPENQFLETETWKTHNIGFEFFQMGYRFNNNFKIYIGSGIDWTHMRLKKNITILPDQPQLDTAQESIDFKKNRFSNTYLRVPLSFQIRSNDDRKGNKMYFVFGPEIGFLINGKTKQVSDDRGKEKVKDDFNLNPFRYGAFGRLGYDDFGIYVKYYNNDVFADSQGPKDLKNLNFGIMIGF